MRCFKRDRIGAQSIDNSSTDRRLGDDQEYEFVEIQTRMQAGAHRLKRLELTEDRKTPLRRRYRSNPSGLLLDLQAARETQIDEHRLQLWNRPRRLLQRNPLQPAEPVYLSAQFGIVHALKLRLSQPGDEDIDSRTGSMLQIGSDRAITGHVRGVYDLIVMQPRESNRDIVRGWCSHGVRCRVGAGHRGVTVAVVFRTTVFAVKLLRRSV